MTFDTLRNVEAPEYKYFTVDVMSNEILSEIPFRGVSYERAIKGAGTFSGSIAVNDETAPLELYNSTMPGNTALFVVRNGICVWGGIIWSRNYDVVARSLSVDASEFTSYFYHRRIWKTWNHEYGATMVVTDGLAALALDFGSTQAFAPGSRVRLEFREPSQFRYNNYYTVARDIASTTSSFALETTTITADVNKLSCTDDLVTIETDAAHGFSVDDIVEIDIYLYPDYSGSHRIVSIGDGEKSSFSYALDAQNLAPTSVTGTVSRSIPDGTYLSVTVVTHTDTYDYVRKLIDAVFNDFSGLDFPNKELEPGLTYNLSITKKKIEDGIGTITTDTEHSLVTGQIVLIENLDDVFDGKHVVKTIPTSESFTFEISADDLAEQPVAIKTADIEKIRADTGAASANGLGVFTPVTLTAHGFRSGETADISTQLGFSPQSRFRNGTQKIAVDEDGTEKKFSYNSYPAVDSPAIVFSPATVQVTAGTGTGTHNVVEAYLTDNTVTVTTDTASAADVGDTITVAGVSPFYEVENRSYSSSTRTIDFTHTARTGTVVTMTTAAAHGLLRYQTVTISGSSKTGVNGTFTVLSIPSTTSLTFNTGTSATYAQEADDGLITTLGTATLSLIVPSGGAHPIQAGDTVLVAGITEKSEIESTKVVNSSNSPYSVSFVAKSGTTATVTTSANHGLAVDDYVSVSGTSAGSGAFNGTFKVLSVPSKTTFTYATSDGTVTSVSSAGTVSRIDTATLATISNHGFFRGDTVTIDGIVDTYSIENKSRSSNVATLTLKSADGAQTHNVEVGDKIGVANIYDKISVTRRVLTDEVATITLASDHDIAVNDVIVVKDVLETYNVLTAKRSRDTVTLTVDTEHNVKSGETIVTHNVKKKFTGVDGNDTFSVTVTAVGARTISYEYKGSNTEEQSAGAGAFIDRRSESVFNGEEVRITAVDGRSVSYRVPGAYNVAIGSFSQANKVAPIAFYYSNMNGVHEVASINTSQKKITFSNTGVNVAEAVVEKPMDSDKYGAATVRSESRITGDFTVHATPAANTIVINVTPLSLNSYGSATSSGTIYKNSSSFNASKTVYAVTDKTIEYSTTGPRSDIFEEAVTSYAYVRPTSLYNVTGATVTAVDDTAKQISYTRTHGDAPRSTIMGYGQAVVAPVVRVGTYGPYTENADIGITFSTGEYSGVDIRPKVYRGFELVSVGEALDKYSDSVDGFEYRVDCAYDADTRSFTKTFVLIPIDYPNPPASGEISPLSRFGAQNVVFEYPGNISNFTMNESAEYSSTRFFASGETDLGGEAGFNFSAAADTELLNYDSNKRKWPLLDDDEKVDGVDAKSTLYQYAKKYMTEARPPDAEITVKVNGSLEPVVGTYSPGDWCSIVVNDRFVQARLSTDFETRDEVLVRKIESINVSVPDGVTFPEVVSLKVVPEWEVDKRG
jgi:hypothetical protein